MHKEFYVIRKNNDTASQFARLDNLLDMCGENKRIIKIDNNFERISNDDFKLSDSSIDKLREKSIEFIKKGLE